MAIDGVIAIEKLNDFLVSNGFNFEWVDPVVPALKGDLDNDDAVWLVKIKVALIDESEKQIQKVRFYAVEANSGLVQYFMEADGRICSCIPKLNSEIVLRLVDEYNLRTKNGFVTDHTLLPNRIIDPSTNKIYWIVSVTRTYIPSMVYGMIRDGYLSSTEGQEETEHSKFYVNDLTGVVTAKL